MGTQARLISVWVDSITPNFRIDIHTYIQISVSYLLRITYRLNVGLAIKEKIAERAFIKDTFMLALQSHSGSKDLTPVR